MQQTLLSARKFSSSSRMQQQNVNAYVTICSRNIADVLTVHIYIVQKWHVCICVSLQQ